MRRLEDIPNVGVAVADDLRALGITAPTGLVGRDPWALYAELNARRGCCHADRFKEMAHGRLSLVMIARKAGSRDGYRKV